MPPCSGNGCINKKTFCRYYPTMDDLLPEVQTEISSEYIEQISRCRLPEEPDKVNGTFFRCSAASESRKEQKLC